jgi:hypothetical protein
VAIAPIESIGIIWVRSQISKQDRLTKFASPDGGSAIAKLSSSRLGKHRESVFWLSAESGWAIAKDKTNNCEAIGV